MYDKNTADLIGTIVETPRYKKTENTEQIQGRLCDEDPPADLHRIPVTACLCDRVGR
jgi:hypothetical protein